MPAQASNRQRRVPKSLIPNPSVIHNLPVKTLAHKDLTIEGYSRAAVQTYWRVPELKVGFDLGAQPWSFMGTPVWMVSHTHLDHLAALPVYVARRRMMKMEPPVIYLPEAAVEPDRAHPAIVQPALIVDGCPANWCRCGRATKSSFPASWW